MAEALLAKQLFMQQKFWLANENEINHQFGLVVKIVADIAHHIRLPFCVVLEALRRDWNEICRIKQWEERKRKKQWYKREKHKNSSGEFRSQVKSQTNSVQLSYRENREILFRFNFFFCFPFFVVVVCCYFCIVPCNNKFVVVLLFRFSTSTMAIRALVLRIEMPFYHMIWVNFQRCCLWMRYVIQLLMITYNEDEWNGWWSHRPERK